MVDQNVTDMGKINPTAHLSYVYEGAGIGSDAGALDVLEEYTYERITSEHTCIEIGFGHGFLVEKLVEERCVKMMHAIDICEKCLLEERIQNLLPCANINVLIQDCSHVGYPLIQDSSVDFAFCTETIEHLSNPYFMVANVKRILKHGGWFVLAFPMPEDNLGYDGGEHAHVYPGFLLKESFDRFMLQLYFKQRHRHANGSSAWYIFQNYKGEGMCDTFKVISGSNTEEHFFGAMGNF